MAEKSAKANKDAAAPAAANVEASKKSFSFKGVILLASVLVIEAVAISAVFLMAGKPAAVQGADSSSSQGEYAGKKEVGKDGYGAAKDGAAEMSKDVELLVVSDRFQNTRTGRTYIYDTEIFVVVARKEQSKVESSLKAKQAQIVTDIATIFRRAELAHMQEPTLATLTGQITAALEERIGRDAEGKTPIDEVLIKKCTQFRADF